MSETAPVTGATAAAGLDGAPDPAAAGTHPDAATGCADGAPHPEMAGTHLDAATGCADGAPHPGMAGTHLDAATGLIQITGLVQGIYARVSERHELTPVQARLLCVLLGGPRGMAELAQCFGVEKAALTGLMDRAERRGLAQRSPVPGDRRALRVTLTDAGHRAAAAFHADVNAELGRLVATLDPHDREHFCRTMAEIMASCRAPRPPDAHC